MPATPPPASPAPESATTALYRAALGPVNTAHHLPAFERFDAAGRAGPVWNWAAGFMTLNWMLFRQLWGAALVYVICVGGLLLLLIGPLRDVLQWPSWPQGVQWGAAGVLLLLSVAIPGAFGPAILHADTRRRITRAVRKASTVREACATLAQQASTRRRLWGLAGANGLLAAAAVAVTLWGSPAAAPPLVTEAEATTAPPPVATDSAPLATETAAATEASAPVEPPASEPVEAEVVVNNVPPPEREAPAEPVAPVVAAQDEAAPVAKAVPMILAPKASLSQPQVQPLQAHGINVGLFADRTNAEKAHARLLEAGLPAILQNTESAKGAPLTRVRVGPLASRAQAEQAAERIRAMGLEAQVFAPGG